MLPNDNDEELQPMAVPEKRIIHRVVSPRLIAEEDASLLLHSFLTRDQVRVRVGANEHHVREDGRTILLYLPGYLSRERYERSLEALENLDWKPARAGRRAATRGSKGFDRVFGYIDWFINKPNKFAPESQRQYPAHCILTKLVQEMDQALLDYLPEVRHQMEKSLVARPEDEAFDPVDVPSQYLDRILGGNDLFWNLWYSILGCTFTTLQLNKSIIFRAHQDGNNSPGSLSALTALGSFYGGELVFPEFGLGVLLRPRDLLIADVNTLYHGNIPPLHGTRYSIVAYQRPFSVRVPAKKPPS